MRHPENARFRTRHWAELWKANVPNVQSLKDHASKATTFVAIDADPWSLNNSEFAEIGITILAPVDSNVARPTCLEALQKNFAFRCHRFGISGRQRGPQKKRENEYWGAKPKVIGAADVEEAIIQALGSIPPSFKTTGSSRKPQLCLIGFDLNFEFRVLSAEYPRVLQCFSSWVDSQHLVMELAGLKKQPSMETALLAFGFKREHPVWRSPYVAHNAGNDSLRIILLLLNLLNYNSTLVIPQDEPTRGKGVGGPRHQRRLMGDDRFFKGRPKPRESYPFAAWVYLDGHTGPGLSVKKLYDTFNMYNPVAVSAGDLSRTPPYDRGWAFLASLEELIRFVAEVDGRACCNGVWGGTWRVASRYDASITPAKTAEELEKWLEARSSAVKEQNMLSRKQKEHTRQQENVDPVDLLGNSWVLGESEGEDTGSFNT